MRPAGATLVEQRLGLRGGPDGAGDATREVDRDDVVAGSQQRLVGGEEVADRRLRGGRQVGRSAQTRVEGVVVGDLALAPCLRAPSLT